jgi:PKD repeat protein
MTQIINRQWAIICSCIILLIFSCKKEEDTPPLYTVGFSYSFLNSSTTAPANVNFTNSSTGATSYTWYFGDNTSFENETSPTHTYQSPGTYIVSLVATFPDGNSLEKSATIEVLAPAPPIAAFSVSPSAFGINDTLTFTNNSTNAVSYTWDFNDGSFSSAKDPVHIYTAPGTYFVTLTAYNAIGQSNTVLRTILISATPFANLTQISIGQLLATYNGSNLQLGYGNKIIGTVISDIQSGNYASSKNIVIWDGIDGITVRTQAPHSFDLGEKVVVSLNTAILKSYFGNLQIDSVPNSQVVSSGQGVSYPPLNVSINQVLQNTGTYINKLIKLQNVTISGNGTYFGNVSISDGVYALSLYTYPNATFINQSYPLNPVSITGIIRLYNGTAQLVIRNLTDIQ